MKAVRNILCAFLLLGQSALSRFSFDPLRLEFGVNELMGRLQKEKAFRRE